jgi:hypothetical protein
MIGGRRSVTRVRIATMCFTEVREPIRSWLPQVAIVRGRVMIGGRSGRSGASVASIPPFSAALLEAESPRSPSRAASVRGVCFAKRRNIVTRGLLEVNDWWCSRERQEAGGPPLAHAHPASCDCLAGQSAPDRTARIPRASHLKNQEVRENPAPPLWGLGQQERTEAP